ncbi:MAG: XRE family transcriptional regulator [Prevotella sp.]|nr:XRE family transcriptional regulator [Prevotella sp.]
MIHIGQCIRQQLEAQGKTSVWLAHELGCHRTNIYKIYDKMTIDTGILLHISRILNFDFFSLYSEEMAGENASGV